MNLYNDAITNVCQKYLSDHAIIKNNKKTTRTTRNLLSDNTSYNTTDSTTTGYTTDNTTDNSAIRRSLRLNNVQDNKVLSFNPDIMYNSIVRRTRGYENARKLLKENKDKINDYDSIERSLQLIHDRLQRFGYGLYFQTLYSYKNNNTSNVFDAYELRNT
jgi:hypothetical protein